MADAEGTSGCFEALGTVGLLLLVAAMCPPATTPVVIFLSICAIGLFIRTIAHGMSE